MLLWQIPLIKMRRTDAGRASVDATRRALVDRGYAVRTGGRQAVPQPRLVVPARAACPTSPTPRRRALVDRQAPLPRRRARHRRLQDRRRRARLGHTTCATSTARDGGETNNRFPVSTRAAYGDLLRSAGKTPVTFSRAGFTGSQAHGAFWAGDEDSTWEAFRCVDLGRADRGGVRDRLLGLGPRRLLRAELPDAELYLRVGGDAGVRADHAVPLGVQPPPPAVARPHAVEHRRAAPATPRVLPCSGGSPSCASGSCRTSPSRARARPRDGGR